MFIKYLIVCSSLLSLSISQLSTNEDTLSYCLQNRPQKNEGLFPECVDMTNNFCTMIQCQPIDNCDDINGNKAVVQNLTARGCCPACVEYLDEYQNCEVGAKLKRCRNGLFCDPSTKQCNLPAKKNRCMREAHNRRLAQKIKMVFYVMGNMWDELNPIFFQIPYATDMEPVTCDAESGNYELKQCRGSKCFCVEPESGQYSFGMSVKDSFEESAQNLTCKCADYFQKKLVTGKVDRDYMEHYADIHQKCDTAGNFEKLQCINQTCFCVDEKTGRPDFEHVAVYGALSTLPCFDTEKAKKLNSKDADLNYQSECERQLLRTQQLSLHFTDKGTKLRGLDKIACSFDGKFAPKQCKPEVCDCVTPDTCSGVLGGATYSVDRSGGKDSLMNCRCAREVYYATTDKKGYDRLQCEGQSGNYKAFQNFNDGKESFCVDENGSRISEEFLGECAFQFIKAVDTRLLMEDICQKMRITLTDQVLEEDKYYVYNRTMAQAVIFDQKPKPVYCENSGSGQCKCV